MSKKKDKKEQEEKTKKLLEKNKISLYESKEVSRLDSEKLKNRERKVRIIKLALLIIALFLMIIYFLLRLFYEGGAFTITLDEELARRSGLVMYEKLSEKNEKKILKVDELEFVDNISINWLPENIDEEGEGTHNGPNYIAYTFYIENKGADTINYWYKIVVDDVIKDVDKAIRVMVFRNGEKTVYAKANERTGAQEIGTVQFKDNLTVVEKQRTEFKVGDIDKFTIVIWVEGDDPDCVDALIGGMMKMHMDITEEHVI
ncbi:MAG: hypothetical protein ACI4VE_06275 [Clostridia bacterium]